MKLEIVENARDAELAIAHLAPGQELVYAVAGVETGKAENGESGPSGLHAVILPEVARVFYLAGMPRGQVIEEGRKEAFGQGKGVLYQRDLGETLGGYPLREYCFRKASRKKGRFR